MQPTPVYRVLVGMDMSNDAAAALNWAAGEADARAGELIIVHAFEHFAIGTDPWTSEDSALQDKVREAERRDIDGRIAEVLPDMAALPTQRTYVEDLPARALTAGAATADLLVIGAHGDRLSDRAGLGSTPRTCLQYPLCPVVVISAARFPARRPAPVLS